MADTQQNTVAVYKSGIVKAQETYVGMITQNAQNLALSMDQYQTVCVKNAVTKMFELLNKEGLTLNNIDQNNITMILEQVSMLNINLAAVPKEGYIILRGKPVKRLNKNGVLEEVWVKEFEFSLEGDGNDKLLRKFGVDVKKVHNCWLVREGDEFTYASFDGLTMVPPKWTPKGYTNKVVRVVYPIELMDGTVEFHIAEREGVAVNLQAHIINNIKMKKKEEMSYEKKDGITTRIASMSLEAMLKDEELRKIMSPAWRDPHSQEGMIVRKMRNNATRKFPKDLSNAFVASAYEKTFEDYEQYQESPSVDPTLVVEAEIEQNSGTEQIQITSIDSEVDEEPTPVETVNAEPKDKTKAKVVPFD